jgi:hypothetical protein
VKIRQFPSRCTPTCIGQTQPHLKQAATLKVPFCKLLKLCILGIFLSSGTEEIAYQNFLSFNWSSLTFSNHSTRAIPS